jgi:uncharacterized protein YecT (DUF1311 family)
MIMLRQTLALVALCSGPLAGSACCAEEPPAADVAAVKAWGDLVATNKKKLPLRGPDEFEEKVGPDGRLAGAAKLTILAEESCIGVLATACLQREGETAGDGQYSDCYRREAVVWDKRLNVAYRAAQAKMEKGAQENLRTAQRAWIAWRDLTCKQPWMTFQGSMAGPMEAHCGLELTGRQAIWMEGGTEP